MNIVRRKMDAFSATALVLSVLTAIGAFVSHLHLKKIKICCIESDCFKTSNNSEPTTPLVKSPK